MFEGGLDSIAKVIWEGVFLVKEMVGLRCTESL